MQPGLGFRCRTLADYLEAVQAAPLLDRRAIRSYALDRFSIDVIGAQYEAYFDRLLTLWGDGWYTLPDAEDAEA